MPSIHEPQPPPTAKQVHSKRKTAWSPLSPPMSYLSSFLLGGRGGGGGGGTAKVLPAAPAAAGVGADEPVNAGQVEEAMGGLVSGQSRAYRHGRKKMMC